MDKQFHFLPNTPEKPATDFSKEVLLTIHQKAEEMLQNGSELESVDIGEARQALWISLNPEDIIGWKTEKVSDRIFYIGQKKE